MITLPRPRLAAATLLSLALSAGCPSSDDGSCESSAVCAAGELCFEGRCVASLPVGSCTPPDSGTLAVGTLPKTSPDACNLWDPSTWPRPVASVLPAGWLLPLSVDGVADPDYVADPSVDAVVGQTVSFSLPAGASSLMIFQQGVSAAATFDAGYPNYVGPTDVTAPSGATIFVDDFLRTVPRDPSRSPVSYLAYNPWAGSFALPQTSRLTDASLSDGQVPAGAWSFRVSDWNGQCFEHASEGCYYSSPAAGTYDVSVVARPGPFVSTGRLDVGVYLVGKPVGFAAAAISSPGYQRFVWALAQLMGRAGICLGTVTFFDIPDLSLTTPAWNESPPCGDLARLFSLASTTVDGVHLFLVNDFTPTGQGILGIDGSIPGPSGFSGSATSGAAMVSGDIGTGSCSPGELDPLACGSDAAGYIAAHEIGHWLGLYHTTEYPGDQFDPLSDTGTCACDACGGDGCDPYGGSVAMAPSSCVRGGECTAGDNLMFWAFDPSVSRGVVSAEQGLVMRINPAVK